jgi:hypothetical protein
MNYEEKKSELEARFKPASAALKLAYWLEANPDEAPKAAKKAAKKVEPVEEAEE